MSVPPGNRGKSTMQFVETADKIEQRTMQICRHWPKAYMFIITQRTIMLASEIYEHAQKANAIFPKDEEERALRIRELDMALGALYAYARKIERAYSMFPICGEKKNVSESEVENKSNNVLKELMDLCLDEEESLKGNLHYTRSLDLTNRQKQPDSEPQT